MTGAAAAAKRSVGEGIFPIGGRVFGRENEAPAGF